LERIDEGVNLFHLEGVKLIFNIFMDKLEICKSTRKIAADSLYTVLKKLLASTQLISEVMLRDEWLEEMQKNKTIFTEGWYIPPPHGMIVLFATDKKVERINYKSVRIEEKWPRNDIFLDKKNGLAYFYASPVDKQSGIIGDFGMTVYLGKKKEIKDILKHCLVADKEILKLLQQECNLAKLQKFPGKH